MEVLKLNPWLRRKDLKQTNEVKLSELSRMALAEKPEATLNIIALYIIQVSPTWRSKGYNQTLLELTKEYKINRAIKERRKA